MEELFMRALVANQVEFGQQLGADDVSRARALVQLASALEGAVIETVRVAARLNEAFEDGEERDVQGELARAVHKAAAAAVAAGLRLSAGMVPHYPELEREAGRYLAETTLVTR